MFPCSASQYHAFPLLSFVIMVFCRGVGLQEMRINNTGNMIMAHREGLMCESMTLRVVIVLCRGNFKIGISTLNKDDA